MRYYADLHIHSRYARACSPQLTLENIDLWCRIKGLSLVSCGDFTHPKWFAEIQTKLEPVGNGLYRLKRELRLKDQRFREEKIKDVYFIIGTELSCIYTHLGKGRRVHHCLFVPSIEAAAELNKQLTARGCNLKADGRPIIGLSSQDLLKTQLAIDPRSVLIPAHAWTPWFAIFGSKSGYDSITECFGGLSKHIFAIETGLSSDPAMNWRVSDLDKVALISNSDAHSLPNLGREANVFEGEDISYDLIWQAVRQASPQSRQQDKNKEQLQLSKTIEFFPHEGRYHFDGHRDCQTVLPPSETRKYKGICPKCGRQLTVGVLSRVEDLSNRKENYKPASAVPFLSLIELDKIIAQAQGVKGRKTKAVDDQYWRLVEAFGGEMNVLAEAPLSDLSGKTIPSVVEAIKRLRDGKVFINPGYDGVYGEIHIFNKSEAVKPQKSLF